MIEDTNYNAGVLKNGIKNMLLSNGVSEITRFPIKVYGREDWTTIKQALSEWERKGYLQKLKDPELAEDHEICVRFLTFFEYPSPIPGFLNWEG
jgi:hypothetical protein